MAHCLVITKPLLSGFKIHDAVVGPKITRDGSLNPLS